MTQNVTVKYKLSAAGQRAALIAGRNASQTVTETMVLEDAALLEHVTIAADGSLSLDVSKPYSPDWVIDATRELTLDAPPETIAGLLAAWMALKARVDAVIAEQKAAQLAAAAERTRKEQERAEHDFPLVESVLAELEALDRGAPLPAGLRSDYNYIYDRDGKGLMATPEQMQRNAVVHSERSAAARKANQEAAAAEEAARDAVIEEHGGHWWMPEGGMTDFRGYDLWSGGQTKRWVGIFTDPKGIASFLDSPRGEHTFDVSRLAPGDLIQGGGYDTNSRGKRRNESSFFGVVIRNDEAGLVVDIHSSRAATFAAAAKLEKKS